MYKSGQVLFMYSPPPHILEVTGNHQCLTTHVITQTGLSSLMDAASNGMTEVVSLLLEAGADTHIQNKVWMSMNC